MKKVSFFIVFCLIFSVLFSVNVQAVTQTTNAKYGVFIGLDPSKIYKLVEIDNLKYYEEEENILTDFFVRNCTLECSLNI